MRSINLTLPPVMNVWIWLFWKVSTFLRYLIKVSTLRGKYKRITMVSLRRCSDFAGYFESKNLQVFGPPLHFLHHVQCSVDDELIHMGCLLAELGCAISARFGGTELMFEERIVFRTDDGEVVRHVVKKLICKSTIGQMYLSRLKAVV